MTLCFQRESRFLAASKAGQNPPRVVAPTEEEEEEEDKRNPVTCFKHFFMLQHNYEHIKSS